MGVVELVDHIEATHHRYLWDELPRLSALVEKVAGVHGGHHPELAEVVRIFAALRADLEPHLTKEERVLFATVLRGPKPGLEAGINGTWFLLTVATESIAVL
ncbi:MAG: hemerythrin domain-containing protein, partial [Candidatus Limnocylindria bacterium]